MLASALRPSRLKGWDAGLTRGWSLLDAMTASVKSAGPSRVGSTLVCCLAIALASRMLFATLFIIGRSAPHLIGGGQGEVTLFGSESIRGLLASATAYGDFRWYSDVAVHGYTAAPFSIFRQQNWAFFPLQPWLIGLVHGQAARFAWGEITFLAGTLFFGAWAERILTRSQLVMAVSLLCFSPYAACLSQFRPDSVLFAALAAVLYFSQRRLLIPTLLALVLASLAKPNGFLGAVIAAPHFLVGTRRTAPAIALATLGLGFVILASVAGPLLMSLLCARLTGAPLAWSTIQAAWGNELLLAPARQVAHLVRNPRLIGRGGWDFELYDWGLVALVGLSTWNLWRRGALHLAVFGLAYFMLTFAGFGGWTMMKHLSASPVLFAGLALVGPRMRTLIISPLSAALGALFGLTCVTMGAGFAAAWV